MSVRHPAFFGSLFLARLADQILLFLVPLVVFQTTHQVAWSGIAFTLEALPRYLVLPFCGALCDRVPPLRLMRISQSYRALSCVLGLAAFQMVSGIGWLIALSAVCGVLTSQGLVAREVMLPSVFPQHKFEKILSYAQLADQMGVVLGPMLAALLLQWWSWQVVVAVTAGLFGAADLALLFWQRSGPATAIMPPRVAQHWSTPFRIACAHVWVLPGLKQLVLLAAAENLVIGITLATSAAMVTGLYHRSGTYYAGLQTAGAIATVLVLLAITRGVLARRMLGLLSFLAIFAGAVLAGASASHWGYALGFLLIVGFDKMFSVYIRSERQRLIPPADYGKTTGVVILLNNLTQPLAGLLVGLYASAHGAGTLILWLAGCMGGLGAAVVLSPRLAKRRVTVNALDQPASSGGD